MIGFDLADELSLGAPPSPSAGSPSSSSSSVSSAAAPSSITSFEACHAAESPAGRPIELGWGAPEALLGGPVMAFFTASAALDLASLAWLGLRARRRALT